MRVRMKSLMIAALVFPAASLAQNPSTTPPAATRDTTTATRRSPVQFLLFGYTQSSEIRTTDGVTTSDESGPIAGVEFLLALRSGAFGLHGRLLSTDGPAVMEGGVVLGSRKFALDLAYMMRDGFNPVNSQPYDSTYAFARAGFRSRANLGNTGFTVGLRGGYYVGIPGSVDPGADLEGWEGESQLAWTWSRFPLTVLMGYRLERFRVWGIEQETSALTFGGGVALGRR
jgi:hypothetical protein